MKSEIVKVNKYGILYRGYFPGSCIYLVRAAAGKNEFEPDWRLSAISKFSHAARTFIGI